MSTPIPFLCPICEKYVSPYERHACAGLPGLQPPAGAKHDDGKDPWHLLPWEPVRNVVRVLAFGAQKYAPHGWQKVPNARERYFSAVQRHLLARYGGELLDPDSKLPHLAHAACNLLFLAWFDMREGER